MNLTKELYHKQRDWSKFYTECDYNITFAKLYQEQVHESWNELFEKLMKDPRMDNIYKIITDDINDNKQIFPKPDNIFNAFKYSLDDIKVVIVGQDPYFGTENYGDHPVPQAMGLSFSVPFGFNVPSSLQSIYNNMVNFKVIKRTPKHGNLEFWACQGCFMINSALTVRCGEPNSHANEWRWFTNMVINYISEKLPFVVFVLWGSDAMKKSSIIDLDKHEALISSHPSGLSASKPLQSYPPFNSVNHFEQVNKLLTKKGKDKIIWRM